LTPLLARDPGKRTSKDVVVGLSALLNYSPTNLKMQVSRLKFLYSVTAGLTISLSALRKVCRPEAVTQALCHELRHFLRFG
jgi:hypothetical protein